MYLSRFGVKNYKCFGEIDIPLTPIHVLIGENDSGKTSLLEAMAALFASSEQQLSGVFPGPWDGTELVLHGTPESTVELWGEWDRLVGESSTAPDSMLRYGFTVYFPREGRSCSSPGNWIEIDGKRHILGKGDQRPVGGGTKHGANRVSDGRRRRPSVYRKLAIGRRSCNPPRPGVGNDSQNSRSSGIAAGPA